MKSLKKAFIAIILSGACGSFALAQNAPLPAGHSAVDQSSPATAPSAVPAGVCPVTGSTAAPTDAASLPPAAPGAGATNAALTPDSGCPVATSSTQPSEVGSLTIHVMQKTPGAAAVGADAVNVQFLVRGQLLDHLDSHLNAAGQLDIGGLPIKFGLQPIVHITHDGASYAAVGSVMDGEHASQTLEVPIYQTTDQAPNWSVSMRHVILQPTPDGLEVTEMISVTSPGDHAWIGTADAKGNRTTLAIALPPGAKQLSVGGAFDTEAVGVVDGKLITRQPLVPGDDRYQLRYIIPAINDSAQLVITAPASVGHMLVFVPDDGTTINAPSLQFMGTQQMGDKGAKTRCYIAMSIASGQTTSLTVSGLKGAAASPAAAAGPADQPQAAAPTPTAAPQASASAYTTPNAAPVVDTAATAAPAQADHSIVSKVIAVGGGVAILAAGTAIILFKSPAGPASQKGS